MENKKLLVLFILLISIEIIIADCNENQVDINTASAEELDRIKWVGPSTALSIINSRPYQSLDDLLKVYGIGEVKLNDIKTEGIACVENENPYEEEEKEDEVKNETREVISVSISSEDSTKENKKETINLNAKDINTETSSLFKGKYALVGLMFFSVLIVFLLLLKFKSRDKNEFR